ncbi:MAG: NAD-binding protein [Burkholderiales bacterium]|nr:NAD-binding protein [Burkholderiales bacterium]
MPVKSGRPYQYIHDVVFSRGEWVIIGILTALTVWLGYTGYTEYYVDLKQYASLSDLLYKTLGLFTLGFSAQTGDIPWQLDFARWLAPLLLSYAAVRTLMLMLHGRLALLRLRQLKNHAVVCGLGGQEAEDGYGWTMVQALVAKGIPTVVIEPNPLNVHLGWTRNQGITVITGNARDNQNLIQANVKQAGYLLALTEDDAANSEIVFQAFQLKQTHPNSPLLQCIAQVKSHELAAILYDDAVFSKDYTNFSARVINMRQMAARWLLTQHGPDKVLIDSISKMREIRILLLGNHDFSDDLVLRFAKLGHYGTPQPIHVTLAGPQAESRRALLSMQHPVLSDIITITAKDIELSFLNAQTTQQLITSAKPDITYVCAADTEATLIWTKTLTRLPLNCPVIVCQFADTLLARRVESLCALHTHFRFVYPLNNIFSFDALFNTSHDQLAMLIHDHYVASQEDAGDTPENNASLINWAELPETLKDANRNQADHLQIKCRILTGSNQYTPEQIEHALQDQKACERLARMEHDRWIAEKLLDGWQPTTGEKDTARRLSPALVPWNDLPESERQKDRDAVANIPQLLRWIEEKLNQ